MRGVFYALHPLLMRPSLKRMRPASVFFIAAALCGGLLYSLLGAAQIPAPIARLWEFFLGIGLALLMRSGINLNINGGFGYVVLLIAPIVYLIPTLVPHPATSALEHMMPVVLAVIYACAIFIAASADIHRRPSGFRFPWLVKAGEVSYCFYLVHATVLYAVLERTGFILWSPRKSIAVWIGVFCAAYLLAYCLHRFIERPCEARIRSWSDRRFS
ncbi:acyltransferase [Schaalia sp. ZJ1691]|uniref:acyltransferase family protein n=1 Tax=Schaalia sp. ZJ1691 TaxID=2709404 RepID=UPI0013EC35F9|nr:acyltransferase [Schaalia sp. ZJ1691]